MTGFTDRLNRKFIVCIAAAGLFAAASPASADMTVSEVDQALETIFCSDPFEVGECRLALLLEDTGSIEAPRGNTPAPRSLPAPEPEAATGLFGEEGDGC